MRITHVIESTSQIQDHRNDPADLQRCVLATVISSGILNSATASMLSQSDPGGEVFAWTTGGLLACALFQTFGLGLAMLVTGSKLASHNGHGFCFIVACIECLIMPIGTVLGAFTIVVLMRPSVKELFGKS